MTTASPPSIAPVTTATNFEPIAYWAKLPMGVTFRGDATSVATDSDDNVYVFNRGTHPVAVFDSAGNFIEGWGQGEFDRPHGIAVDGDDNLYFVDDDGHFVQKRTREGQVIFTLGGPRQPRPLAGRWHVQPSDRGMYQPHQRRLFRIGRLRKLACAQV